MAINFPDSPSVDDTHVVGTVTYKWDGTVWNALGTSPTTVAAEDITAGNLASDVLPYSTASGTSSSFRVPFLNTTGNTSGNYGLLLDSAGNLYYNPSSNTLVTTTFSGALSGNASTATSAAGWTTGRTITLSGDVSGTSPSWDGTGNLAFSGTVVANDSHTHTFDNLTSKTSGTGTYTTTGTYSAPTHLALEVRSQNAGQLVLNAGESVSYATGQTGEFLYVNAESGLQVNSSPDNWGSVWAGRDTATICATGGTSSFPEQVSITSTTAGTPALLVTNAGTANTIARFVGDTDFLEIQSNSAGDFDIINTQQDNGIWFADGTGGVELRYAGTAAVECDSTSVKIHHLGAQKFATQSGGVDVTGAVYASGNLDTDASLVVNGTGGDYFSINHDGTDATFVNLGTRYIDMELTGQVEARVQDSDIAPATSGMQIKDHSQTLRDAGFNHVKEIAMTTSTIQLSNLHAGTIIKRTGTSTVDVDMASSSTEFPIGSMCTVINHGTAGTLTIDNAAETMYVMDGSGSVSANTGFALAIGGVVTIWREAASVYYVWGAGIP